MHLLIAVPPYATVRTPFALRTGANLVPRANCSSRQAISVGRQPEPIYSQTHPGIYWAGYVQDAQKEYAEANITYAVIAGEEIPNAARLGVEPAAYLNGLGEAAGEMRRYILDHHRLARLKSARAC